MWSSYVKPVVWSSFVPCSTYYSTSEVVDSISTSYLTVPVTSYSWTTGTSYTTISTTVTATDYTTQTQTTDDTTWTTATSLTTEPVLVTQHYSTTQTLLTTEPVLSTQYFETTTTLLTTQPISTYETVRTTLTGHKTQTDLETIYTTASLTQTYVTSQTAVTTLTSRTTYETLETLETLVTSQVPVASSLVPLPHPPSSPPPPPPSASSSPPPVISTTPSVVVSSPESTAAPPPVTTPPPPPPPPNPCDKPPVNEFFSVSWFGWRPVPGAEPLVTFYPTIYAGSNITLTSTFCNTQAFEKYYRTNLFDCARGCGPYQTLNDECSIVIGPVFTGTTCGGTGYKITQYGSSGNVVDLDTSIVGRGLTVDGTCIPTTTTVLQTPFIYTGDVRRRNSLETAVARRQASSGDQVAINPSGLADPFSQANNADFNYGDEGRQDSLPGASELFADPKIVDTPPPSSGEGTALPANEPTQASQAPQSPPAESQQQTTTPATQVLTTEPTGSPPILPTSETTAMSGGTQGSMSIVPSGEASLPALTCVPPSMVLPSSATGDSTGLQTSSASGTSLPQQTGNAASHSVALSRSLDWLCAWLGLYLLV